MHSARYVCGSFYTKVEPTYLALKYHNPSIVPVIIKYLPVFSCKILVKFWPLHDGEIAIVIVNKTTLQTFALFLCKQNNKSICGRVDKDSRESSVDLVRFLVESN